MLKYLLYISCLFWCLTPYSATLITEIYGVALNTITLTTTGDHINNQYIYSAYGQSKNLYHPNHLNDQTHQTLNIAKNQFGYTGQMLDSSTALMMLGGFRNYAPAMGRFLQPDTYNSFSKKHITNAFAYVIGNPMRYNDPSGHVFQSFMRPFSDLLENQVDLIRTFFSNPFSISNDALLLMSLPDSPSVEMDRSIIDTLKAKNIPLTKDSPETSRLYFSIYDHQSLRESRPFIGRHRRLIYATPKRLRIIEYRFWAENIPEKYIVYQGEPIDLSHLSEEKLKEMKLKNTDQPTPIVLKYDVTNPEDFNDYLTADLRSRKDQLVYIPNITPKQLDTAIQTAISKIPNHYGVDYNCNHFVLHLLQAL